MDETTEVGFSEKYPQGTKIEKIPRAH